MAAGRSVIVVDIGCADHEGTDSLGVLADKYRPTIIYGFDPSPVLDETVTAVGDVRVILKREAAWIRDGDVCFFNYGVRGYVAEMGPSIVPCFDLARFLTDKPGAIVKIDAEGAEYPLLQHLIDTGVDFQIGLLLVEWHGEDQSPRYGLHEQLHCPLEEWWL